MQKRALNVEFSVPVSDAEKKQAQVLRDSMDELVQYIEEFVEFYNILFESLDQINSGKELLPIGHLIVKYKYKMRDKFNNVIRQLSKVLVEYKKLFSESKTDQMQEIIKEHFSEVRLKFIDLLAIMDDVSSDGFLTEAKEIHEQINKYLEKVVATLRDEWIAHIDKNILAKVKLS